MSPVTDERALGHPLRLRILERLNVNGPMEPNELATAIGAPLGVIAYHVNVLRGAGVIEEIGQREARGAVAHMYRALRAPCAHCGGSGLGPKR